MKIKIPRIIGDTKKRRGAPDACLIILTLALSALGTLFVFSAGTPYAEARYGDGYFFIKRQIIFLAIGIVAMLLASTIPPSVYARLTPALYISTVVLLVTVLIFGLVGNGAKRWISIGPLTLQPSEIAKMALVMALSLYFSRLGEQNTARRTRGFVYGTLIPISIMALPILLVMLQKHLSCIIILGLLGILMILSAGSDAKYIGMASAVGGVGVLSLALFTDYTKERITVWQNPEAYRLTGGWQTLQGLMAIGSGGLFGVGFGKSVMKRCYVSEPANDMIFAIICEEVGLVGALFVLLLFALFSLRCLYIASRLNSTYERLVTLGVCYQITVQALLNVAVVTNTIPNTGISLPFFSYGGSSLIMTFFEVGMLLSFSRGAVAIK